MENCCHLFVYGTLKPEERAFGQLCQPFVVDTQSAQAQGRLYHLPLGYPAMTPGAGWVQGMLLTFANADCLQQIDAFEEYYPDRPHESEYQRRLHPIYDVNQRPLVSAWVYTMAPQHVVSLGGQWLTQGCWSEAQSP